MPSPRAIRLILAGGLIAGAGDIIYAIVTSGLRGVTAIRVLQSVASGLLGAKAFSGGWTTAALGLGLHFLISLVLAVIFYLASRSFPFLVRHAVIAGLAYGFIAYWVMYLVVLPLSAITFKISFTPQTVATGLVAHLFLVGLPIALAIRRATPPRKA